jgi:hypothetical protein
MDGIIAIIKSVTHRFGYFVRAPARATLISPSTWVNVRWPIGASPASDDRDSSKLSWLPVPGIDSPVVWH